MNKKIIIVTATSIMILSTLIGCSSDKIEKEKSIETQKNVETKIKSVPTQNSKTIGYKIVEKEYISNNIKVKYPEIAELKDKEKQEIINDIIKTKAISIYDETIKELEKGQTYEVDGNYEIKLKNEETLSIAYTSYNNISSSAYPYSLFYTTNIDIKQGKELTTKDIIPKINYELINLLKDGNYVGTIEKDYQEQLMKFVYGTYPNPEDLIDVVKNAYVYLTDDSVGISIPVPHVAGDYVPIEINKEKLKNIK